jgi:simple sugar transport system permease protein
MSVESNKSLSENPKQSGFRLFSALRKSDLRWLWTLLALVLILLVNRLISPNFFEIRMVNDRLVGSLINVIDSSAPYILLAVGMTLVIATKGIDLSVGAVMAISAAVAVELVNQFEAGSTAFYVQPGFAILIAILVGALCGIFNGVLVAYLDLQPFIATLILMVAGRGIAQLITGGQSPTFTDESLAFVGRGVVGGIPVPIIFSLIVLLLVMLLVRRTALGLMIESVGANDRASHYAGIPGRRIKLRAYMICSMCAALAGLMVAGEVKSADPHKAGLYIEADAILAVVIGGTLFAGGRFYLARSAIGAVIIQALVIGLYVSSLHPTTNLVVKAFVVLAVLLLQSEDVRRTISRRFRRTA